MLAVFGGFAGCVDRSDTGANPTAGTELRVTPAELPADGKTYAQIDIWVRDGDGSPQSGVAVVLQASGPAKIEQPTAPTDAAGHAVARIASDVPGLLTLGVEASIARVAVRTPATAQVRLTPAESSLGNRLSLSVSPAVASVDVATRRSVVARLVSSAGAPVANAHVALASSRSGDILSPSSGLTTSEGTFSATLMGTQAGVAQLSASGGGAAAAPVPASFLVGAPDAAHTYFLTQLGNVVQADGTGSGAEVFVGDQYGNPVSFAPVSIASSAQNVTLVPPSGTADGQGVFHTSVAATDLGSAAIVISAGSTTSQQGVQLVVGPPSAATSVLSAVPATLVADGVSACTVSAVFTDAAGHPRVGDVVSWASTDANDVFTSASGVTDSSGAVQSQVRSTHASAITLYARAPNLTLTTGATFQPGPPSLAQSSLVVMPASCTASSTAAVTLTAQLRDAQGNPIPGESIQWAASDNTVLFGQPATSTDASGQAVVTLTASHSGNILLSAAFGASTLTAPLSVTPASLSLTHSALTVSPATLVADGNAYATLTLAARDIYNNAIAQEAVTLSSNGVAASFSALSGNTDAQGHFVSDISGTQAGTLSVTAMLGAQALSAPVAFVAGPISGTQSTLLLSPNTATADGQAAIEVVVHFADAYGNPVIAQPTAFSASGTQDTLVPPSGITDGNGQLAASWTSTQAATQTLLVQAGNYTTLAQAVFLAGSPNLARSSLTISPNLSVAGGNVTATLSLQDAFGNPTPGLTASLNGGANVTLLGPLAASDASGQIVATLTTTLAQNVVLQMSSGAVTLVAPWRVVPGSASLANCALVLTPNQLVAGATLQANLLLADAYGNPLQNRAVSPGSLPGVAVLSAYPPTNTTGQSSAVLQATLAQNATLTAQAANISLGAMLRVVAGAPNAALSALTLSSNTAVADGNQSIAITAQYRDAYGNPVTGQPVSLNSQVTRFLSHRYSLGGVNKNVTLAVNGAIQPNFIGFNGPGLQYWRFSQNYPVSLQSGNNLLVYANTGPTLYLDEILFAATQSQNSVEAEQGTIGSGASLDTSVAGYVGTGYVHLPQGGNVTNVVQATPINGNSYFYVRYACLDGFGQLSLALNGNVSLMTLSGSPAWVYSPLIAANVLPGNNTVTWASTSHNVLIDQIWLMQRSAANVIEAETGSVSGSATIASSQSGFLGTGYVSLLNDAAASYSIAVSVLGDSLGSSSLTTDPNGMVTTSWTATVAETKGLSAVSGNVTLQAPAVFVAGPPSSALTTLWASTYGTSTAGVPVVYGVQVLDAQSNPVSGIPVLFSSSPAASFSAPSGVTNQQGTVLSSATFTAAGLVQTCAQIGNTFSQCQNIQVVAGSPNGALSHITVTPNLLVAGGNFLITAALQDAYGNAVSNQDISWSGGNSLTLLASSGNSDVYGALSRRLQTNVAQNVLLTVSSPSALQTSLITILAGQPSASASTISLSPSLGIADGNSTVAVQVHVADFFGNPVANANVALAVQLSRNLAQRYVSVTGPAIASNTIINNILQPNNVIFPYTGSFTYWSNSLAMPVVMQPNINTIQLSDANGATNIDYIALTSRDIQQTFEAETGTLFTASLGNTYAGYSGSGYVVTDSTSFMQSATTLNIPSSSQSGNTFVMLRYSSTQTAQIVYMVNGNALTQVYLPTTGALSAWQISNPQPVTFAGGNNKLAVINNPTGQAVVLIDQVIVLQRGPALMVEAETGVMAGGARSLSNISGFSGSGFVGYLNPGASVTVSASLPTENISSSQGTTNMLGNFSLQWASSFAEKKTLVASIGNVSIAANAVFNEGSASMSQSLLTLSPNYLYVNGSSVVTMAFYDVLGNPVRNAALSLAAGNGLIVTSPPTPANAQGVATAVVQAVAPQNSYVRASCQNVSLLANVTIVGNAMSATSTVVLSANSALASSTNGILVTGHLADANGLMLANEQVTLSAYVPRYMGFRYAAQTAERNANLIIDGIVQPNAPIYVSNNYFSVWANALVSPALVATNSSYTLAGLTNSGINIDYFEYSAGDVTQILEAETASLSNGSAVASATAGFRGTGYVNLAPSGSSAATLPVFTNPATPNFLVGLRYHASSDQNVQILANGSLAGNIFLPSTFTASDWQYTTLLPVFTAGGNTQLQITNINGSGLIDEILVTQRGATQVFQAENGLVNGGATVLTSPAGYTGSGFVGYLGSAMATVAVQIPPTGDTFSPPTAITDANGNFSVLWSSTTAEAKVLHVNAGSYAYTGNATFVAGAPSLATSRSALTPSGVMTAGSSLGMGVALQDALGNPVPAAAATVQASAANMIVGNANLLTDGRGLAFAPLLATQAGNQQVCAQVGSSFAMCSNILVLAGPPSAAGSVVTMTPNTMPAGGNVTIGVQLRDAYGNAQPNYLLNLSGGTNLTVLNSFAVTDGNGFCSTRITSTLAQSALLQMSGGNVVLKANLVVLPGIASLANSYWNMGSPNGIADNNQAISISAHYADIYGNPAAGQSVAVVSQVARSINTRYAGNSDAGVKLIVNGTGQPSSVYYDKTAGWGPWTFSGLQTIPLQSGNNTVTVTISNNNGLNFDYLLVSSGDRTDFFEAEALTLAGNASISSSFTGYSGSGYVNFPATGTSSLTMQYFALRSNPNALVGLRVASPVNTYGTLGVSVNNNFLGNIAISWGSNPAWAGSSFLPIGLIAGNNLIAIQGINQPIFIDQVLISRRGSVQQIEAESGTLAGGAQLEATYTPYSGTGYVAYMNSSTSFTDIVPISCDSFFPAVQVTDANGNLAISWRSSVAETKQLSMSLGNASFSANYLFFPGPPSSSLTSLALGSSSINSGSNIPIGVSVVDALMNAVGGVPVTLTATSRGVFSALPTDANGEVRASLAVTGLVGQRQVCAQVGNFFSTCQNFVVTAGSSNASLSFFSVSPNNAVAGASVTRSGTFVDSYGNPCSGQAYSIMEQLGAATVGNTVTGVLDANGRFSIVQGENVSGGFVVSFTGAGINYQSNLTVTPNTPYQAVASGIRTVPAGLINDLNIAIVDCFGNLTPNYTGNVTISVDDVLALTPAGYSFSPPSLPVALPGSMKVFNRGVRTLSLTGTGLVPSMNPFSVATPTLDAVKVKQVGVMPEQCLNVQNNNVAVGANLLFQPCNSHFAQMMQAGSDGTLRFGNRCLTLSAPYNAGSATSLQNCVIAMSQQWARTGNRIVSVQNANICLGYASAGANPTIGGVACSGGNVDVFAAMRRSKWFTLATNYWQTMSPTSGTIDQSSAPANRLTLQYGSANIGYNLNANDQLALPNDYCLDLVGQTVASGANITFASCQNIDSQRWVIGAQSISPLTSPNLCIQRRSDSTGATFLLQPCSTNYQQWSFPIEYSLFTTVASINPNNQQVCITLPPAAPAGSQNLPVFVDTCQHSPAQVISKMPYPFGTNAAMSYTFPVFSSPNLLLDFKWPRLPVVADTPNSSFSGQRWLDIGAQGYGAANVGYVYRNASGYDFELDSNNASPTSPLLIAPTVASSHSQWWYTDTVPISWSPQSSSQLCMAVGDSNGAFGQSPYLATCSGDGNQQFIASVPQAAWSLAPVSSIVALGLCLEANQTGASSALLRMNTCQSSNAQLWRIPFSGGALSNLNGLCVDSSAASQPNVLGAAACNGASTQNFALVVK